MEKIQQFIRFDFVRFCIVGASGFIINFILLAALYRGLHIQIFIAQLVASEISLFSNFIMHNNWTYKHKRVSKSMSTLLWQFHATSWVAILGSAALESIFVSWLHINYILALAITSVIALGWNFAWSKLVIWRHEHDTPVQENKL